MLAMSLPVFLIIDDTIPFFVGGTALLQSQPELGDVHRPRCLLAPTCQYRTFPDPIRESLEGGHLGRARVYPLDVAVLRFCSTG